MENGEKNAPGFAWFGGHLTARSLAIGVTGSALITAVSMYVALRMGALPWSTIFAAVLSMTALKALGNTNVNEINVTHTAMTAGSMVAGGLAFTMPGLYMLSPGATFDLPAVTGVTLGGTILGVAFTWLVRERFVERERLPYPIGVAASETVLAGDKNGAGGTALFVSLGISAAFTLARDLWNAVPALWLAAPLAAQGVSFGIWMAPMAVGIGYLIGRRYTLEWFAGAAAGFFGLVYGGVKLGIFPDPASASAFKDCLGIGLMVGTGIGIIIRNLPAMISAWFNKISKRSSPRSKILDKKPKNSGKKFPAWILTALLVSAGLFIFLSGMKPVPALLTILGAWAVTSMAAQLTGQTGINPMEIFAIIVLLAAGVVCELGVTEAFYLAAAVAVVCGLAGDVMNDFKSGSLLKTDPRAQMVAELAGGAVGAVVSALVFMAMRAAFGASEMGPGTELPAPQAYALSTMVGGLPNHAAFFAGLAAGALLCAAGKPVMTLGIGMYLPMYISCTVFAGGLVSFAAMKFIPDSYKNKEKTGVVVASGLLGGEGVTGVLVALWKVFSYFSGGGNA